MRCANGVTTRSSSTTSAFTAGTRSSASPNSAHPKREPPNGRSSCSRIASNSQLSSSTCCAAVTTGSRPRGRSSVVCNTARRPSRRSRRSSPIPTSCSPWPPSATDWTKRRCCGSRCSSAGPRPRARCVPARRRARHRSGAQPVTARGTAPTGADGARRSPGRAGGREPRRTSPRRSVPARRRRRRCTGTHRRRTARLRHVGITRDDCPSRAHDQPLARAPRTARTPRSHGAVCPR